MPAGITLHHADVTATERSWFGPVPATSASRTLNDCAESNLAPELLLESVHQALRRGLVTKVELGAVATALGPFGGLAS